MKAAAARPGTSAWSPNPPTLRPLYPQQVVFVPTASFSPHGDDGLSTPQQTGAALSGCQAQEKGMRARTSTALFRPKQRRFSVLRLRSIPQDAKENELCGFYGVPGTTNMRTRACNIPRVDIHLASSLLQLEGSEHNSLKPGGRFGICIAAAFMTSRLRWQKENE